MWYSNIIKQQKNGGYYITVKEVLANNHYIDYIKMSEEYQKNKINVYKSDGSGKVDTNISLCNEVIDYFIDENNTINLYI